MEVEGLRCHEMGICSRRRQWRAWGGIRKCDGTKVADTETDKVGLTVVFDYSGTLSLDAVAFARSDILVEELRRSGLAEFSIAAPETFWDRLVNPTWEEGSRGPIGYRHLLTREISAAWSAEKKITALPALDRAASAFVARYLQCSRIDPSWHPLLRALYDHPRVVVVVATDHYAEATAAIVGHLRILGMEAVPLGASDAVDPRQAIIVANSADIGFHKDEEEFWRRIRESGGGAGLRERIRGPLSLPCPGGMPGPVVLVDDFGGNEASDDQYGRRDKVAARQRRTAALLAKVFTGPVEIYPFLPSGGAAPEEGARRLIDEIAARIADRMAALNTPPANDQSL